MRRLLNRLIADLGQDDLFTRVLFALFGLILGGIGATMLISGATRNLGGPPLYAQVALWVVAIVLTTCGSILGLRCVLPRQSRAACLLDKFVPDAVGLEEAAFLIIAIYLPAALLTLLLRLFGVRGQQ
jgi:hypothetical protein